MSRAAGRGGAGFPFPRAVSPLARLLEAKRTTDRRTFRISTDAFDLWQTGTPKTAWW
jgi:hypothetical protein